MNKCKEYEQNKRLFEISYEFLQEKVQQLQESIKAISHSKYVEDDYKFQIENQTKKINELIKDNDMKMVTIVKTQHQLSVYKSELIESIE